MKRSRLLAAAALLLLTACAGSLFRSKDVPTAVYLLSASSVPQSGSAPIPADLAILRPRVRAGLNSDHVAALYPDRRLDFFAGARWSGPLDEVVQDLAVQAFQTSRRLRAVAADASAFASGYWLEISVADFQAEYASTTAAPTVHVQFLATVGSARDRRVLGRFEAAAHQIAADNRLSAIIEAYGAAADQALGQLVAATATALETAEAASVVH